MLKGDLTSTPLAPLLLELANDAATGCLTITDSVGDEALVYVKSGLIYSVSIPGDRPQLGAKLVSSGALAPEALAEALEAQRTELQGWRLGELLVHLGYVEQEVVEDFVKEQVCEAVWDLIRWPHGEWKFRKNIKAREDVGPPVTAMELLETLRDRGYKWETISAVMHGPGAVPKLSARSEPNPETTLDSDAWSMLCKIDGDRSVAELARDCGYTLFEAGHVVVSLVRAGLVDIEEDIEEDDAADEQPYAASMLSAALSGQFDDDDTAADAMAKLARLAAEVTGAGNGSTPAQRDGESVTMRVGLRSYSEESFATSIARVSNALAEVLGDVPPPDIEPVPHVVHRAAPPTDPDWQRQKEHRAAAAAELATAQALIETLRTDGSAPTEYDGEVPKLQADESAHAAEEAARVAAEEFARAAAEEAERVAAEQEAQRMAAAAELAAAEEAAWAEYEAREAAEQLRAERAAAEEAAWAEHQEREEAERVAAQEAARLAAEAEAAAAEAERVRAEREAAEQARLEAERLAAEQAERLAAEEAERLAAEEAGRAAAEAAEQARAEAERMAAEEAERARLEAEHLAAEEAARLEAERLAAEEAERARIEANRLAAEHAERAAAEAAEQARAEGERIAAEEAARQEAERDAAEAAAAARQADEAAAAKALLVELAAATASEPAEEAEPEDTAESGASAESEELADPDDEEPADNRRAWGGSDHTDTAALLRELSSLGGEEPTKPSGSASSPPTRTGTEKKPKKKIGLFGL